MVSILIIFVHCCKYNMYNFTFSRWQTLPAEPLMKHADTQYPLSATAWIPKGLSCETQLIECVDDITRNIDAGKQTDCLIMDVWWHCHVYNCVICEKSHFRCYPFWHVIYIKKEISWGLGLSLGVFTLPIAPRKKCSNYYKEEKSNKVQQHSPRTFTWRCDLSKIYWLYNKMLSLLACHLYKKRNKLGPRTESWGIHAPDCTGILFDDSPSITTDQQSSTALSTDIHLKMWPQQNILAVQ
jgi:hypothetical protein